MGFFSRSNPSDSRTRSPQKCQSKSLSEAARTSTSTNHEPPVNNINGINVVNLLRNKWRNRNKDSDSSPSLGPSTSPRIPSEQSEPMARPRPPTENSEPEPSTSTSDVNRQSTDALTLTLAQRLRELSTANAEGLLDDDEYRVLRQSVFDRFAGNEIVPAEVSIIPHSAGTLRTRSRRQQESESRPPSTLNLSITSNSPSLISQFGSIVRRGSKRSRTALNATVATPNSRRDAFHEKNLSSSSLSQPHLQQFPNRRTSGSFTRPLVSSSHPTHVLSHSLSSSSIRNFASNLGGPWHNQSDTKSVSSIRTGHTARSQHAPSSFRLAGYNSAPSSGILDASIYDEGDLKTSEDIKAAIAELEKEVKGLMDAFKGLEISMQVGSREHPIDSKGVYSLNTTPFGSTLSLTTEEGGESAEGRNHRSPSKATISRSNSRITLNRSSFPIGRKTGNHAPHPSQSSTTSNYLESSQTSVTIPSSPIPGVDSSNLPVSSLLASSPRINTVPLGSGYKALPSLPQASERSTLFSSSSHSPSSGHNRTITMARKRSGTLVSHTSQLSNSINSVAIDLTTSDSGIAGIAGNDELAEVRRRRADVGKRYEARLDFLRAKLKGVEMREKLSRT